MTRNDERKSCKTLPDAASTYINKGEIKILQTLHKTLHSLCISLILRALHCVGFKAKILHKSYMKPYILEHELNTNLGEGKVKFEEGKEKFEEGK